MPTLTNDVQHMLDSRFVLLIAGSRDTYSAPGTLRGAKAAVETAHRLGWAIIVGDAWGVDREVINHADRLRVPTVVFGISPKPRNAGTKYGFYAYLPNLSYRQRDQFMIELCDRALFIWNGISNGTTTGYLHARKMGVTAHLVKYPRRS